MVESEGKATNANRRELPWPASWLICTSVDNAPHNGNRTSASSQKRREMVWEKAGTLTRRWAACWTRCWSY